MSKGQTITQPTKVDAPVSKADEAVLAFVVGVAVAVEVVLADVL